MGMVMIFCQPNQAKMEACDALPGLHHCDSSELSVVVVRRYSLHSMRDIPFTLSACGQSLMGTSSTQFPLDWLCLHQLIPFSWTKVLLPHEEGRERLETYPHLPEILWESSEEEHCLSDLISLSFPTLATPSCLQESTKKEGGLGYHPASTQTEGGSGYHPALKLLQDANHARVQLEYKLIQEAQE